MSVLLFAISSQFFNNAESNSSTNVLRIIENQQNLTKINEHKYLLYIYFNYKKVLHNEQELFW